MTISGVVDLCMFQELDPHPITPIFPVKHLYLDEEDTHYPQNWECVISLIAGVSVQQKNSPNAVEIAERIEGTCQDECAV